MKNRGLNASIFEEDRASGSGMAGGISNRGSRRWGEVDIFVIAGGSSTFGRNLEGLRGSRCGSIFGRGSRSVLGAEFTGGGWSLEIESLFSKLRNSVNLP